MEVLEEWLPLALIGAIIIISNITICWIFKTNRKMRQNPTNILICNQACADLSNGIIFVPLRIASLFYVIFNNITPFANCYIILVSLFSLLLLAVDRYLLISRPLSHRQHVTSRRICRTITAVWSIPVLIALIPLVWWFEPPEKKIKANKVFIGSMWSVILGLTFLMLVLYSFVIRDGKRFIRRHDRRLRTCSQHRSSVIDDRRLTLLMGLLLLFFIFAYLPIVYMNFMDIIDKSQLAPPTVSHISTYSFLLNSIVNPILCVTLKEDFFRVICNLRVFKCLRRTTEDETSRRCSSVYSRQTSSWRLTSVSSITSRIIRRLDSTKEAENGFEHFETSQLRNSNAREQINTLPQDIFQAIKEGEYMKIY